MKQVLVAIVLSIFLFALEQVRQPMTLLDLLQ